MQMTSYPDVQKESGLPVYTTGVGLYDARNFCRPMQTRERMFMLTTAGTGSISENGETHELTTGSVCCFSEGAVFTCTALTEDWTVHWITFAGADCSWAEHLFGGEVYKVFHTSAAEELASVFRAVYSALSQDPVYGGFTASAELYRLIILLNREAGEIPDRKARMNPAVAAVIEYINENYAQEITLEMLCRAAGGLSEQYLCRLFKQTTGMRPVEFILKKRIGIARSYLEKTDLPISEIAEKTGFHNTSYFYRNFKKFTGCSPLTCRQNAVHAAVWAERGGNVPYIKEID